MNRHHPYGGYDAPRRGQSPSGPGPERYGRGSGRGGRGGRGGHHVGGPPNGNWNDGYDQGPPGGGGYRGSEPQYPYQDGAYGGGGGYDRFEDGNSKGTTRRRPPRERDDKVHDSLIEQRIQRERPCRTLFIRNIKYETDSAGVRAKFEEFGEIKTFFDLISNRGMVFVTYYDLRAAERARERLQSTEISGRPIDVHYSLPRGDEQMSRCDRDKNQGTLLVTLRNSPSGQPIDDLEIRRKFQQFGDVKSVKPVGDRPDQRYVELYDTRACEQAHDRLRHQGLQDGVMEISFAWDVPDTPLPPGPIPVRRQDADEREYDGHRDRDRPRGRGRGRGGRGGGGGGGYDRSDYEYGREGRGDEYGRSGRDRGGRYDDDRGPHRGGYDDRYGGRDEGYSPGPSSGYGVGAGYADAPQDTDRLEQTKKVQQLLAALKPQGGGPPPPAAAAPPATSSSNSFFTTHPAPPPPAVPPFPPAPANPYSAPVSQPYAPPPPPAPAGGPPPAASLAALPASIVALLSQTQQAAAASSAYPPPPPPPAVAPQNPYMQNSVAPPPPPQPPVNGAAPAAQNPAAVQQLLAMLAQAQSTKR